MHAEIYLSPRHLSHVLKPTRRSGFDTHHWEEYFGVEFVNETNLSWEEVISGCAPAYSSESYVHDIVPHNGSEQKRVEYEVFPDECFWKGLELVCKNFKENLEFMNKEIYEDRKSVFIPFMNVERVKFLAIFRRRRKSDPETIKARPKIVCAEDYDYGEVILLPIAT